MKKAIITTTINDPWVLLRWAEHLSYGDVIIAAGDHKTPHDAVLQRLSTCAEISGCETVYLFPSDQTSWKVSEIIGWNSIQRRNIALLEAIKFKPDIITTIDDDNYPASETVKFYKDWEIDAEIDVYQTDADWYFNPGRLCYPPVVHRGYPFEMRGDSNTAAVKLRDRRVNRNDPSIGVWASLWLGDPDIDAVTRITVNPKVISIHEGVLEPKTWGPFNSQATTFRAELAPLMAVWPGVGRYDDIWMSYMARAVMDVIGSSVYYGFPAVTQNRNEHDLIKDLEGEIFGMKHTNDLCNVLRHEVDRFTELKVKWEHPIDIYEHFTRRLQMWNPMPHPTARFLKAWPDDVRKAQA